MQCWAVVNHTEEGLEFSYFETDAILKLCSDCFSPKLKVTRTQVLLYL